eukprot:679440-Amphidinium_carterae.1
MLGWAQCVTAKAQCVTMPKLKQQVLNVSILKCCPQARHPYVAFAGYAYFSSLLLRRLTTPLSIYSCPVALVARMYGLCKYLPQLTVIAVHYA